MYRGSYLLWSPVRVAREVDYKRRGLLIPRRMLARVHGVPTTAFTFFFALVPLPASFSLSIRFRNRFSLSFVVAVVAFPPCFLDIVESHTMHGGEIRQFPPP